MPNSKLQAVINELKKIGYEIPEWCTMHPFDHADGAGGCWGIAYGYVKARGEDYCKDCPFHKNNTKRNINHDF